MTELIIASIMTMMTAATPLVFAATGEGGGRKSPASSILGSRA